MNSMRIQQQYHQLCAYRSFLVFHPSPRSLFPKLFTVELKLELLSKRERRQEKKRQIC